MGLEWWTNVRMKFWKTENISISMGCISTYIKCVDGCSILLLDYGCIVFPLGQQ